MKQIILMLLIWSGAVLHGQEPSGANAYDAWLLKKTPHLVYKKESSELRLYFTYLKPYEVKAHGIFINFGRVIYPPKNQTVIATDFGRIFYNGLPREVGKEEDSGWSLYEPTDEQITAYYKAIRQGRTKK